MKLDLECQEEDLRIAREVLDELADDDPRRPDVQRYVDYLADYPRHVDFVTASERP